MSQLNIAVKHKFHRGLVRVGDFLFDISQCFAALQRHFTAFRLEFAAYQAEQGGFTAAVLANQSDALIGIRLQICLLEQGNAALQVGHV